LLLASIASRSEIPSNRALERFWNAAAGINGDQWRARRSGDPADCEHRRSMATSANPRRPTVTPEVAGSSPVAPVFEVPGTRSFRLRRSRMLHAVVASSWPKRRAGSNPRP
jgi:hypothetical protein